MQIQRWPYNWYYSYTAYNNRYFTGAITGVVLDIQAVNRSSLMLGTTPQQCLPLHSISFVRKVSWCFVPLFTHDTNYKTLLIVPTRWWVSQHSHSDHSAEQTREYRCTKEVLPQVLARSVLGHNVLFLFFNVRIVVLSCVPVFMLQK